MREPSGAVFCRIERRGIAIRKSDFFGIAQRDEILSQFIKDEKIHNTYQLAKEMKCKQDDIPDADCLAVTTALKAYGLTEIIPAEPQTDSRGLLMQMVVPKL